MRRVLLLIPSHSYRAQDFLAAAAALDLDVVVGSDHLQVLADFSPGRTLHVDLSDPARGVAGVLAHARRYPLQAVIGTDDESAVLAAHAARALGLAHNDPGAVAAARDKLRFREALAAAGVPGPAFRCVDLRGEVDAAAAAVRYPCVVKPRSLSAGRGVIRADDARAFAAACARTGAILRACRGLADPEHRDTVLVEDYLPGAEVAVEALLDGQRLHVLALMDKPDPLTGPFFEETLLVTPSRLPQPVQQAVAGAVRDAAQALGLRHGALHAELRVQGRTARVLEIAPRSVGGLCSRALRFRGQVRLEELILREALGEPLAAAPAGGASGVMMIPVPRAGRMHGISGVDTARAVPGIEDVAITMAPGDALLPLPEGGRYPGFLFARGDAPAAVEAALRAAHRCLRFEIG